MAYPHQPAAFINAIAEEGTKAEAVKFLQEQWNECCALRTALREIVGIEPGSQGAYQKFAKARDIAAKALSLKP